MGSTGAVPTTIHHQATFLSSLKHSRRLKHNRSNSHLFLPINDDKIQCVCNEFRF